MSSEPRERVSNERLRELVAIMAEFPEMRPDFWVEERRLAADLIDCRERLEVAERERDEALGRAVRAAAQGCDLEAERDAARQERGEALRLLRESGTARMDAEKDGRG